MAPPLTVLSERCGKPGLQLLPVITRHLWKLILSTWLPMGAQAFGQILFWCIWYVRLFLDDLHIWSGRLCKAGCSLQCEWPHSSSWKPEQNKKPDLPVSKGTVSCLTAFELLHRFRPAYRLKLQHGLLLGHKSACLWTGNTPSTLLVLRPSYSDWNYIIGSFGSPACWL